MSRGNVFLGTARGKVGDIVLSRRLGVQVARAYTSRVNDRKSESQVLQRSKIQNIAAIYRALRTFMQRAFESKPAGQTDYNAFSAANLSASKVLLPAGVSGAGVVAPYLISRGTLQLIEVVESAAGLFTSDIALPSGFDVASATVGEFSAAVVGSNADWRYGDQLTIVRVDQLTSADGIPYVVSRLYDVTLSEGDGTLPFDAVLESGGFLSVNDPLFVGGLAFVQSRMDANNRLLVSPASLLLTSNNTVYTSYTSEDAATRALNSRGFNPAVFLEPGESSGGSGPVLTGSRITGMTIGGTNVLNSAYTSQPMLNPSDVVRISGTGLDTAIIQVRVEDRLQLITEYVTFSETTPELLSGTVTLGAADPVTELVLNGRVVRKWSESGWVDPSD